MNHLHPVFARIVQVQITQPAANDEIIKQEFITAARNGEDGGQWASYHQDSPLTLQSINAIVRRSNLDPETKLKAVTAAIDVAINDAADFLVDEQFSR